VVEHYCEGGKWKPGTSQECEKTEHAVRLKRYEKPTIHDGRKK
jgi:hypothetical protein